MQMRLYEIPIWFLRGLAIPFGLIWGSFLNVVIYRVPREMSVAHPPSHCPGCGKPIAPYDNIPLLSYAILRGKARCCGTRMSPRYPIVELIGGALSLAILEVIVRALPGDTMLIRAAAIYAADFTLVMALVAAAFIDAEHMYLPDAITLGGAALGVCTASLRDMAFTTSVFGAAAGFVGVWLPLIVVYKRLRGRQGMGMGDAKLLALAGAWFGYKGALFVLFAGAIQGTFYAMLVHVFGGKLEEPESVKEDIKELEKAAAEGDEEAKQILADDPLAEPAGEGFGQARMPFGPFLILACLELLLLGDRLEPLYQRWLAIRY